MVDPVADLEPIAVGHLAEDIEVEIARQRLRLVASRL